MGMIQWEKNSYPDTGVYWTARVPFLPSWSADDHGDVFLSLSKKKSGWYIDEDIRGSSLLSSAKREPRLFPKLKKGPYPAKKAAMVAVESWINSWCPRLFGEVVARRLDGGGIVVGETWEDVQSGTPSMDRAQAIQFAHWVLRHSRGID